jgi:hypothetical protein
VSASAEISAQDQQVEAAVQAVTNGRQAAMDRAERQRAAQLGTAGALPQEQQQRLVDEHNKQLRQKYTNAVASGQLEPAAAQAAFQVEQVQYLAKSGIVQPTQKRIINAGLSQDPMIDGQMNPAFQEAVEAYMTMAAVNPAVADKYIDIENRGILDTITSQVANGGNVASAIYGYSNNVRQYGNSPYKSPDEFLADEGVQKRIDAAVQDYIAREDIGFFQGLFRGDTDISQMWDRRGGIDLEVHAEALQEALAQEVANVQSFAPHLKTGDIIAKATQRVERQVALVGGDILNVGKGNDVHEMFFGNRAGEMSGQQGAINSAIAHYMRSPQFRAEHPLAENSTAGEAFGGAWFTGSGLGPVDAFSTMTTGVRPFRAYPVSRGRGKVGIAIQYSLPGGGYSEPFQIDPAEVGGMYLDSIRQTNR